METFRSGRTEVADRAEPLEREIGRSHEDDGRRQRSESSARVLAAERVHRLERMADEDAVPRRRRIHLRRGGRRGAKAGGGGGELAGSVGIPALDFRMIRRTVATLANGCGSAKDVQTLLRHSRPDMAQIHY